MKILKIIPGLPTNFEPNRMIWLENYITSLSRQHEIKVIVLESLIHYLKTAYILKLLKNKCFPKFDLKALNVKVIPIKYWGMPGYFGYRKITFEIIKSKVLSILKHEDLQDIDLIHAHFASPCGTLANILSKHLNKPYIITEHSSNFNHMLQYGVDVPLVFKEASHVISVSPVLQDCILSKMEISKENMSILSMGTDFSFFNIKENSNNISGKIKLLFAGALIARKGCDLLIKALKILKENGIECELDIIGDGEESSKLHAIVNEFSLQEQVKFHGLKNHTELCSFYQNTNIFVLPSLNESLGMVLVEAFACGKPVVATVCGGPETFVNKKTGVLVQKENAKELAEGIRKVINNYSNYNPQEIRNYALNKFSIDNIAISTGEIYKRLNYQK